MYARIDQIQRGWSVYGRDGEHIGDVNEVGPNYVLMTKGLIFVHDLYVPLEAIDHVDAGQGQVYLNVDKSAVENQGWEQPPTGEAYTTAEGEFAADGDRIRVPVHEEELRAERTAASAGEVQVRKNVVEEERHLDVPVTREEVEVRRVSTDRPARASDDAFTTDGDTIRVPVTAERVEVSREPRVVEEIEISKRPVTETQRVSGTVRREEVEVDETGNVLTGAGASMTGASRDLDDPTVSRTRGTDSDDSDDDLADESGLPPR